MFKELDYWLFMEGISKECSISEGTGGMKKSFKTKKAWNEFIGETQIPAKRLANLNEYIIFSFVRPEIQIL